MTETLENNNQSVVLSPIIGEGTTRIIPDLSRELVSLERQYPNDTLLEIRRNGKPEMVGLAAYMLDQVNKAGVDYSPIARENLGEYLDFSYEAISRVNSRMIDALLESVQADKSNYRDRKLALILAPVSRKSGFLWGANNPSSIALYKFDTLGFYLPKKEKITEVFYPDEDGIKAALPAIEDENESQEKGELFSKISLFPTPGKPPLIIDVDQSQYDEQYNKKQFNKGSGLALYLPRFVDTTQIKKGQLPKIEGNTYKGVKYFLANEIPYVLNGEDTDKFSLVSGDKQTFHREHGNLIGSPIDTPHRIDFGLHMLYKSLFTADKYRQSLGFNEPVSAYFARFNKPGYIGINPEDSTKLSFWLRQHTKDSNFTDITTTNELGEVIF